MHSLYKARMTLVLIAYSFAAHGQPYSIDSLKRVVQAEKGDTLQVNTLNILSRTLFGNGDYINALQYAKKALSLSEQIDFIRGRGVAYLNIGNTFAGQNSYIEALKNYYTALGFLEESHDKKNLSEIRQLIGGIYAYQDNYSEALKNFSIALKLNQEMGNKTRIAQNLTSIGTIYSSQGKYAEALQEFNTAVNIYKDLGAKAPKWGLPFSMGSIAILYKNEGAAEAAAGNKIIAERDFTSALENSQSALDLYQKNGFLNGVAETYLLIAELYFDLKKFFQSKYFIQKGLQLAIKIRASKNDMQAAYQILSGIDSAYGNYKQAYEHYKLYISYRDSLNNEENTKKTLQASMQYEYDKKETIAKAQQGKKDAEAKRIKNLQYFAIAGLGILVLAVIIIAFIQYRHNKQKKKANFLLEQQKVKVESTLSELKSTQSQLIQSEKMASLGELTAGIAHEIQNPLNFVNNFSEVNTELIDELKEEQRKQVRDFENENEILSDIRANEQKINHHGKRADAIVRGMLQHSRVSTGKRELTDINAIADEYLRISYHGFRAKDKAFNATLQTDFDESIGKVDIIPQDIGRVLLNLFNNAFYSVIQKKTSQSLDGQVAYEPTVSVSSKKENDKVFIKVKDNGTGIPQKIIDKIFQPFFTTKPTGQGTGLGLSLSYDIIKAHGGEIKVETEENVGTEFTIILPIN